MPLERSPYKDLLKGPDFKRWVDNVARGSATYGYEVVRRMGYIGKRFKKSPKDFAKLRNDDLRNGLLGFREAVIQVVDHRMKERTGGRAGQ
jgi:hypothetical protein